MPWRIIKKVILSSTLKVLLIILHKFTSQLLRAHFFKTILVFVTSEFIRLYRLTFLKKLEYSYNVVLVSDVQ